MDGLLTELEGRPAMQLMVRDVTEREEAQRALRQSASMFTTVAEAAPFALSVMNPDLSFEYFNPRFQEMFGYTPPDLPDKMAWFPLAYPDRRSRNKSENN